MSIVDKLKERLASARQGILADQETAVKRITICNTCDQLTSLRNCRKCGCFVDAKTKLLDTSCPLNKW